MNDKNIKRLEVLTAQTNRNPEEEAERVTLQTESDEATQKVV